MIHRDNLHLLNQVPKKTISVYWYFQSKFCIPSETPNSEWKCTPKRCSNK